ncbi:hypothetical protein BSU04_12540 [Caballeronia sordidicola]|uniref:Uncharacterized protein n=1 Tax=Caballeronia sordidicola TaxID=196367 RepID=A0A226X638_CABSO|nr:hypothetical protein BSU04_12540 [Caballeronia sordidicola]
MVALSISQVSVKMRHQFVESSAKDGKRTDVFIWASEQVSILWIA